MFITYFIAKVAELKMESKFYCNNIGNKKNWLFSKYPNSNSTEIDDDENFSFRHKTVLSLSSG